MILMPTMAEAQKKDIAQIKTYLKSGRDLDKAENLARKVIAMPENTRKDEAYELLCESLRKQYEDKNMKLYLKTLTDTASVFPVIRRMFYAYEGLDSLFINNDGETTKERMRQKNSSFLLNFRPNLLSGAYFSARTKKYEEAYNYAETYLDCEKQPLFSQYEFHKNDKHRINAACIAVNAASELHNHKKMLKFAKIALQHEEKSKGILCLLYQSYLNNNDTVNAVECLKEGFSRFPDYNFYFPRLFDYYFAKNQIDSVSNIVDKALAQEPGNIFYRQAKDIVLLNIGKYDECISLGDSLIHTNDNMAIAYYNVGAAYFNKALIRERQGLASKQKREDVNALYKKALPYMEKYRTLRPKQKEQWYQILYTIYLNLNMGKEFEDIRQLGK